LADWFAVSALFKRIPIPGLAGHTAIIPANKDKIADNLAVFVQEKFLDTASLTQLVRQRDLASLLGRWMSRPENATRMAQHMAKAVSGMLSLTSDVTINRFIREAIHTTLDQIDLSRSVGSILDLLTRDQRHQQLLDQAIVRIVELINQPTTRELIAAKLVEWLQLEYPVMEKALPSNWLGDKFSAVLAGTIERTLNGIVQDPDHTLRRAFDHEVEHLINRLRNDAGMHVKAEEIKHNLLQGEAFGSYVGQLWSSIRQWICDDLAGEQSSLKAKASHATTWIGEALMSDPDLRDSLNGHLEDAVAAMGPDLAQFVTRHISQTVKAWDTQELSHQIELNIGRDLQFIRINGTLVGALIGAALFGITWVMQTFLHGS